MIGYEFLQSRIPLLMPPLERPARIKAVTRIEAMADILAVPKHVAPTGDSILEHALFALKHQSFQLAVLHEAMKLVPASELAHAIAEQPKAANLRRAAFVWEKANEADLPLPWPTTGGNYVDMFDESEHYTGQVWEKNSRLRVNFNGLGPYRRARRPAFHVSTQSKSSRCHQGVLLTPDALSVHCLPTPFLQ